MATDSGNRKRKVLLVDDHPLVREWLTNLIDQQGDLAVCGQAATAAEALPAAGTSGAEVAVVDLSMKEACGLDLIKEMQKACPNLLILVFSMHDESLYAERALRAGAKGYIMKREATAKVLEAIRCVLAGQFYLSETVKQAITSQFVQGKTLMTNSLVEQLSDRELAVFDLLGQGLGTRQIADRLRLSIKTVQTHFGRVKDKLNLGSGSELVRAAVRHRTEQTKTQT